jgi:3-oxoadipate enol-lactonase
VTTFQRSLIPIVFLPGLGGAVRLWEPQIASFTAAGYQPVALDLPGCGLRPPDDAMNFDMLAANVETAVDARKLDRPIIVGQSFGGMIAQTALRRRPHGYRAAVLAGTSPTFGAPSGEFQKKFVPIASARSTAGMAWPSSRRRAPTNCWAPPPIRPCAHF